MSAAPRYRPAIRRRLYPLLERTLLGLGAFRSAAGDRKSAPQRVIFVCSGNICRSPYAEALARARGLPAVSCGTHARSGSPADPSAIAEAASRGIALDDHRAARWQDMELRRGDLIVAMTLRHILFVLPRVLRSGSDLALFSALLPRFAPIWDPYGRPREFYGQIFDLIDIGISRLAECRGILPGPKPAPLTEAEQTPGLDIWPSGQESAPPADSKAEAASPDGTASHNAS